jgi:prephenate dehydrogenase
VAEHDTVLAATSHLPHVLAYALVDALAKSPASADIFRFAAGGFRDFTRIASSDPAMWRDIAIANRPALLDAIDMFSGQLAHLRQAVSDGDGEELYGTFTRAKTARDEFAAILAKRGQRKA